MYVNCLTKSPIQYGEKVKLFLVAPIGKDYLKGLIDESQFQVLGIPLNAKYDERLNFKLVDSEKEFVILRKLINKELEFTPNKFNTFQKQVQKGSISTSLYGVESKINFMAVKLSIYNQIIKNKDFKINEDHQKMCFEEYKNYMKNQFEDLNKIMIKSKKEKEDKKNELIISFSMKFNSLARDLIKYLSLGNVNEMNGANIFDFILNNLDELLESLFVLKVIEHQGYLIMPYSLHSEGNNKSEFLKNVLEIQIAKSIECDPLEFIEIF